MNVIYRKAIDLALSAEMKRRHKRLIRLAIFIFFFPLIGSTGVIHAQKLRVAYTAFAGTFAILWLGHDAGLYQKHGADMELLFIGSSTTAVQALLGGDVDIVYSAAGARNYRRL
jgi:ABC-type nitrate/sulfonate/bicarbonate transport system substrate-binding protein